MEKLDQEIVDFGPRPLVQINRKKRLYRYLLISIWLIILIVSGLAMKVQLINQGGPKESGEDELLEVKDSAGISQSAKTEERYDELLGAKIINEANPMTEPNGDPSEATGSVEELLDGKEIIVP